MERLLSVYEDNMLWKKVCCYVICVKLNVCNDEYWTNVFAQEDNIVFVDNFIRLAEQYVSFLIITRDVYTHEKHTCFYHLQEPLQDKRTETIVAMF